MLPNESADLLVRIRPSDEIDRRKRCPSNLPRFQFLENLKCASSLFRSSRYSSGLHLHLAELRPIPQSHLSRLLIGLQPPNSGRSPIVHETRSASTNYSSNTYLRTHHCWAGSDNCIINEAILRRRGRAFRGRLNSPPIAPPIKMMLDMRIGRRRNIGSLSSICRGQWNSIPGACDTPIISQRCISTWAMTRRQSRRSATPIRIMHRSTSIWLTSMKNDNAITRL